MMTDSSDPLLTTGDAARILTCSVDWVRQLERAGRLLAIRTIGGQRLFRLKDVLALQMERQRVN
jgi:excisionase family DNA binding protein